MGIGHGKQSHRVTFPVYPAFDSFATAVLRGVKVGGNPLNIATVAQCHHHPLVRNKVFLSKLHVTTLADFGSPLVTVLRLQVTDILLDKDKHAARVGEKVFQIGNRFQYLGVFIEYLFPFQVGQTAQLHIKNGLGLYLSQAKVAHQGRPSRLCGLRFAYSADNRVNLVKGNFQSFQNMGSGPGRFQVKLGTAGDDLVAEINVTLERLLQADNSGLPVHERHHVGEESRLHSGMFVQVIEHLLREGLFLQLNDDAHTMAIGFVTQVTDAGNPLFLDQLRNSLYQVSFVRLIRELGDHDLTAPGPGNIFNAGSGLNHYFAVSGSVSALYPVNALDNACGGEVRPLDKLGQFFGGRLGTIDEI